MKYILYIITVSLFSCKEANKETKINESEIYEQTLKYYEQKNYSAAKILLDTLISLNPLYAEYYFKRGYSKYMLLIDDDGAISDFLKSIEYNYYNKKSAYLNIGVIYADYKKFDSALFYYDKSLELDSNYEKAKIAKKEVLEALKAKKKLFNN